VEEEKGDISMTPTTCITVDLTPAFQAFLSYIADGLQQQLDPDMIDVLYQEKSDRCAYHVEFLRQLATEGAEDQLAPLLGVLWEDWAIKEALQLLHYGTLDPSHQGLQQAFWQKLAREHQALSSELCLYLRRGSQQRTLAQEERSKSWQAVAHKSIETLQQQQQQWQTTAFQWVKGQQDLNQQWFQHQQSTWSQFQQAQQASLNQQYTFVQGVHANTVGMLNQTQQAQAEVVERSRQKRNITWIIVALILGGGAVVCMTCPLILALLAAFKL
jgi:hypothetical protein